MRINPVKVVAHRYEGEVIKGSYDVLYDGKKIGTVHRHDGVSNGYFGRWSVGRFYTDSRKSAVNHLVKEYTR